MYSVFRYLMIPRFANPHSVLETTRIVSRESLNKTEEGSEYVLPDQSRLGEFNEMMKRRLPVDLESQRTAKKRRESEEKTVGIAEEPILFRLVSSGPPVLLSLQPKPPPTLKVREPEIEDNEAQADERRLRALAVAVDADWVIQESLKQNLCPSARGTVISITLPSPSPTPPLMILHHNKPLRRTRPPVDQKLLGYPYTLSTKPEPLEKRRRNYECPVYDLERVLDEPPTKAKKYRRRRRRSRSRP